MAATLTVAIEGLSISISSKSFARAVKNAAAICGRPRVILEVRLEPAAHLL